MPKKYEAMRDAFEAKGMSEKAAKTKAAKIFIGTSKNRSKAAKSLHE